MGYEGYSIVGSNEAHREKIREAALRQEQLDNLEQAIRSRLEREIELFISDLQEQNKLSDIKEDVTTLKNRLETDAEGKARDAINEKMEQHLRNLNNADDIWEAHMNNFNISSWITRAFR